MSPTRSGRQVFKVFGVVRTLHELLWYLTEVLRVPEAASLHPAVDDALHRTQALTSGSPTESLRVDLRAVHTDVNTLLPRASDAARATVCGPRADHRGADLAGRDLQGVALRGASLRGACLMGADLRGATLSRADLTGADLRDARLHGTDLSTALFLCPFQLSAAVGDVYTRLPDNGNCPPHWLG